ncbi:hypothetical protein PCL1606_04860 [Pseudomonas chlororaphis]|uniref:Uncharacterized protein n=1 Tax=Pseudomonas chlororaphis TaxID=587753 RepID=A0A0D5XSW3_9PSED|nr:hypothetical protein PCL1606_04860 [Pseudomonas chlororaphis]
MIRPHPRSAMRGASALTTRTTDRTLNSQVSSQSVSGTSSNGRNNPPVDDRNPPALLTAMSIGPSADSAAAIACAKLSALVTSPLIANARPPRLSAIFASLPLSRARRATLAPSACSARAIASPMPWLAPVIKATRPLSCVSIMISWITTPRRHLSNRFTEAAIRRGTHFRLALGACFGKRLADTFRVEIGGIDRRSRLLTPGLVKPPSVGAVESEFVEKPDEFYFVGLIVTSDRQCDSTGSTRWLALIEELAPVQGIECLHHWPSQLVCHPTAFGRARFDLIDPAITLSGIVVAGIDDDDIGADSVEEILRQFGDLPHRYGDENDLAAAGCLRDGDRRGAGFGGKLGKRIRAARVGDRHLVAQFRQPARQRASDLSGPYDSDVHDGTPISLVGFGWVGVACPRQMLDEPPVPPRRNQSL